MLIIPSKRLDHLAANLVQAAVRIPLQVMAELRVWYKYKKPKRNTAIGDIKGVNEREDLTRKCLENYKTFLGTLGHNDLINERKRKFK